MSEIDEAVKAKLIEMFGLDTILNKAVVNFDELDALDWALLRDNMEELTGHTSFHEIGATIAIAWMAIRKEMLGDE